MTDHLNNPRIYVPLVAAIWTGVAVGVDVLVFDGDGISGAAFGLAGGITFGLVYWVIRDRLG